MNARERLREAFDACLNTGLPPAAYDLYCEVRELLKAYPGPVEGSWAWAVEQMRQGRKVRRRSWTHGDSYVFSDCGRLEWSVSKYGPAIPRMEEYTATDWELLQPAHKPCAHCGTNAEVFSRAIGDKPYMVVRCLGCEAEGPPRQDINEAWRLWDRRA